MTSREIQSIVSKPLAFIMKRPHHFLFVLPLVVATTQSGCESSSTGRGAAYDEIARQAWSVRVKDGVSSAEASALAKAYLHRYVDERGNPGIPVDQGAKWMVPANKHLIYVEKTKGLVSMQYGPTVEPQDF